MPKTFIAIIFLVGSIAVGVLYVWPQWTHYHGLRQEIDDLVAISGEFDDLIKNRDALLSAINSVSRENLARLEQALPVGAHASEFLVSLESYTTGNGVSLKRVDLASPVEERRPAGQEKPQGGQTGQNPVPSQPKPVAASSAPRTEKQIAELPFTIQVSGSYDAFKKFLGALEHNVRLIDIQEISFSSGARADILDFTLKAKTYYQ